MTATTTAIWYAEPSLELANRHSASSLIGHLGIEFTEVGAEHLAARMPVDARTLQPAGVLHGGASVVLAETLASCAATFVVDPERAYCVGMEINANHLRPVMAGTVTGVARPVALGRRTQVWEIRITDELGKLVCVSRCTMAIVER
ncbi:hotdog fold thioesterase [Aeromicrobium sp.]|uniref:hotdog fold thioesterase n=1 Tax=Aeromicrobium sp. TaxID=1871063 RepID=UPI002FCCAB47